MKECPACKRCFPDDINHCPQDGDATTPSLLGEPILDARYQLERRLGQGGMGVVFQARHIFLKTSHAIKVILPDLVGNDPMLVTRFRQEALAAAAIRHQNIIAVTDFGVVRGTMPFLVMEFINGRSLQEILAEEKAMSPARALEFICAIGAGVSAAHRQNIVHRDLKPLNIMAQANTPIAEGVKILDFGLAKIKSGELLGSFVQAKTSGLMGSPFYMAPEQWSDEDPDARADVYSLGIILYQMLAGDVPYKGSSIPSIMKKHLTTPVPSFASVGADVPPRIEAVVRHALEKELSVRTPSVAAFLNELREAVEASSSTLSSGQATLPTQLGETLFETGPTTGAFPPPTTAESQTEAWAGTVGSAALSTSEQERLAASRGTLEFEEQERERIAREELQREMETRRKAAEEKERQLQLEGERARKEKEEREERERRQREQIERVERQAKELEDRLARLATSMPPSASTVDPESTQMHQGLRTAQISRHSIPGVTPAISEIATGVSVPIPAPAPKSKVPMILGGVLLVVLLLGGGTAAFFMLKPTNNGGNNGNNPTPTPTVAPDPFKPVMILIPGGTFQMGRNNGAEDGSEGPAHSVDVASFMMEKSEVTNGEYADFVRKTLRPWPEHWTTPQAPPGEEMRPVTHVSQEDAIAFASWRSRRDNVTYRLPTEEEWEYAARNGDRNNLYPWGDDWKDYVVVNQKDPSPVGSRPEGKNIWGVEDLLGNVWEWTSSKNVAYPGNRQPIPTNRQNWYVFRGGGIDWDPDRPRYPLTSCLRSANEPTLKAPQLGFRLVTSAE